LIPVVDTGVATATRALNAVRCDGSDRLIRGETLKMARIRIALLVLALAAGCASSPTGRSQLLLYSDTQLAEMGAASFAEQKRDVPLSKDASTNAYVRCVADTILAHVDPNTVPGGAGPWEVVVFTSDQANAFALPGRKIGVYTGLLGVAKNASQLAAVVGHEVGHVIARHGNERVSHSSLSQLTQSAVAVTLASRDMSSASGQAIMAGLGLGAQYGVLLPYSRAHESEADTIGLRLMARAGFDPRQSVKLWENMAKAAGGAAPPELLSTHPSNQSRIANLQSHMQEAVAIEADALQVRGRPTCGR
jgi:predicted Zn-dependent protease